MVIASAAKQPRGRNDASPGLLRRYAPRNDGLLTDCLLANQRGPMIGRLNHIAIAVADIEAASRLYRESLGARVSLPSDLPEHGVTVAFVELPNTKVELLQPLGADSPIAKYLRNNPDGGMHHLCFEVDNIIAARDQLVQAGARVLGDGAPKIGAHGKPVLFLHPKDFNGTLIELEQV
jgi:methylmalonyl-CoA/ethylmalonyl-CoA epimerase